MKVNEVKESQAPAVDDEFAKDVSEFETLEAFRADLKEKVTQRRQQQAQADFENAVMDQLVEDCLLYTSAAGYGLVCGCDEAGAGPLAGPVYAAAVILPLGLDVPGLDDSKKLTAKKRESLFPFIQEQALACAVAWVDADEIDATDILSARMRAMQLAIDGLPVHPDFALIDGNRDRGRTSSITAVSYTHLRSV